MARFQKLTRNLFLTLHGHNVHRQQRQLSKFLIHYKQFASHAYCGASSQDGVATGKGFLFSPFWGVQICDYSTAWVSCTVYKRRMVRLFQTVHETHAALYSHIWTPQNGAHRKPFPAATRSWKLVPRPRSKYEKRTVGSVWETWTVAAAGGVRCASVRWEINFLLTFETAPLFCVYPV